MTSIKEHNIAVTEISKNVGLHKHVIIDAVTTLQIPISKAVEGQKFVCNILNQVL